MFIFTKNIFKMDCLVEIFNISSQISSSIIRICTASNQNILQLKKEDRSRLQFLNDTIILISTFCSTQPTKIRDFHPFQVLIQNIYDRMVDVLNILQKIEKKDSTITANFDIFEFKLRGYLEEIKILFPSGEIYLPHEIITDNCARSAWIKYFGDATFFVTYEKFIEMFESEKIITQGTHYYHIVTSFLRYFVNFPTNDVVTTVKFNFITSLIGPFDENFAEKFRQNVSGKGFLGFINRIQAYEILTVNPKSRVLLIRFSRTDPQFLAFSYKNKNGVIRHRLNKDENGQIISVDKFINQFFPGHSFVEQKLDVDKIFLGKNSYNQLSDYAQGSGHYYK